MPEELHTEIPETLVSSDSGISLPRADSVHSSRDGATEAARASTMEFRPIGPTQNV